MVSLPLYLLDLLLTFSPITFLPGLGSRFGGGADLVPRCVATASFGLLAPDYFHKFSGSHLPPKVILPLFFFGKYLSEHMLFISC